MRRRVCRPAPVAPVVLVVLAGAAAAAPESAVRHNEEGIAHLTAGRPAEAVDAFEAALAVSPGDPTLERNLAAALVARAEERRAARDLSEAVALLERASRLHPERLRYRVLLGRARFEEGAPGNRLAARDAFEWVLERAPDNLDALVNLGQLAYVERRLEEAVELWRRALALQPTDADVERRLRRAERERNVEASFEELSAANFLFRYAPSIPREQAAAVLRLCEEAYGRLSKDFRSYPERIAVTLYTPAQFQRATMLHAWVAGLSDGTIRLTVHDRLPLEQLRATIQHELAHHLIRARAPAAPLWLHEGLAQLAEGRGPETAEARLRRLPDVRAAELSAEILRETDPRLVGRYYDLVLAFTHFLRHQRGDAGIDALLERLAAGLGPDEALRDVFGEGRDALFERWHARAGGR